MQLKRSLKDLLKKTNNDQYIIEFKRLFSFFEENYIEKLSMGTKKPKNFIGQNCIVLLQTNLYRAKLLAKGYIDGLNKSNPLLSTLSLRALFETTGSIALLLKKYLQYNEKKITEIDLDEILKRLYLGIRQKNEESIAPDPIGVMTLIDAVDHYLRRHEIKNGEFRAGYEFLSERCHPNSFGYFLGHKIDKQYTIHFTNDYQVFKLDEYDLEYFVLTSNAYMEIYKNLRELIEINEELPFAELENFKSYNIK